MEVETFYCSCGQDFEEQEILNIHKSKCSTEDIEIKEEFIADDYQTEVSMPQIQSMYFCDAHVVSWVQICITN